MAIVYIPILVYTQGAEEKANLGLSVEDDYETSTARFNTNFIIGDYPDKENRTIFHVMGDVFTSPLCHEDFIELVTEIKE